MPLIMNETVKSEIREIMQILDAASKRQRIAFDSIQHGQSVVADTSIEQFEGMCKHIKQRLSILILED